jgi:hypothetical protein
VERGERHLDEVSCDRNERRPASDEDSSERPRASQRRWNVKATWEPYEEHGRLRTRSNLPDTVFAFPRQRKEPLTDAQHVRNAVARFDQVIDVSDEDRALAFANIEKAAQYYNVDLSETNWHQLRAHPQPHRDEAAAKAAATRRRERAENEDGDVDTETPPKVEPPQLGQRTESGRVP